MLKDIDLKYNLVNIHFHTPSEHSLNGKKFSIEGQFVHSVDSVHEVNAKGDAMKTLILSVFYDIEENNENRFINDLGIGESKVTYMNLIDFIGS